MAKRKKKVPAAPAEEDADDDEPELTGFVQGGELYLRCAAGSVYSSERDARGRLVVVGSWADGTIVPLPPPPPEPPSASTDAPPQRVRPPAPAPEPLAFDADELDHCETAPQAYTHVAPLLTSLARSLGVEPAALRIYDPYFCNGAAARHLSEVGFESVHNKNEDFYEKTAAGATPPFDVLLTNPPYSADHPERLLDFCLSCGRPWLLLCPNWVYERPYFAQMHAGGGRGGGKGARGGGASGSKVFFLAPRKRYHYWTPRGRRTDLASGGSKAKTHGHTNAALGARTSPYISFWAGGGFPEALLSSLRPPEGCMLAWSLSGLPSGMRDVGGSSDQRPGKRKFGAKG